MLCPNCPQLGRLQLLLHGVVARPRCCADEQREHDQRVATEQRARELLLTAASRQVRRRVQRKGW